MPSPFAIAAASGTLTIGGGLSVRRLGYGATRLSGRGIWGEPDDPAESRRVLQRTVELGINFIDTADAYGPQVSERLIAKALYPYPGELVIATKGGLTRQGPDQWVPVGRPEYLRQCVEMSLRRLRVERLDLYQLHRVDPLVPLEESLGALKELQEEGKIRHIGLSEVNVGEIERAAKIVPIVSVQNEYNVANRKSEEALTYCEANGLAFIPCSPIAAGEPAKSIGLLNGAANRHGATAAQLALAWLLQRSPVMVPIPSAASIEHLEENTVAAELKLTQQEWVIFERVIG